MSDDTEVTKLRVENASLKRDVAELTRIIGDYQHMLRKVIDEIEPRLSLLEAQGKEKH